VDFRGEERSNATHRSPTDPDCRFVTKRALGTASFPGYTVNALTENRNRILLGVGVETFRSSASKMEGSWSLLARAKERLGYRPKTFGSDKGYFVAGHIEKPRSCSAPRSSRTSRSIAASSRRSSGCACGRGASAIGSQRARKKIEEMFGEAKDWHGTRRFRRRRLYRVRDEVWLIGWVLNLKHLATLLPQMQTA
jgi:hypothetical protein